MALTSVVPSFLSRQPPQLPEMQTGPFAHLSALSSYQTANLSQNTNLNMLATTESPNSLIFHNMNAQQSQFFSNGFHTAAPPEAYRLLPHPLSTLVNTGYTTYCTSPNPGTPMSTVSPPCLLPTPNHGSNQENVLHSMGNQCSNKNNRSEYNNDSTHTQDDNSSVKMVNSNSEVSLINQSSITIVIRLLMSGKEVGSIIGKKGENVKKYREESGAKINISDGSSPERIVTITGNTEQIFIAFSMMSQKFEDDFTQGLLRMGDDGQSCPPVTLRLLVPATQCGSIIGKGGCRIKDVRELTGVSIQVASEALPLSTERTVTISGTANAIAKCIRQLCEIFIESPVKGPVIPYRPKPAYPSQTVICPAGAFSTRIMHPGMTFSSTGSEVNTEHNVISNGCISSFVLSSPTLQQAAEALTTDTTSPISHSVIEALTMASDVGFGALADQVGGPTAVNLACTNQGSVADILADSVRLSQNSPYMDYSAFQLPLLCSLNSAQMNSSLLPGSMLNPLSSAFVMPEVTFNPGLFFTPQPLTGLTRANNVIYTGIPNSPKSINNCSKDYSAIAQNQVENNLDSLETQSTYSSVPDLFPSNPLVSLIQSDGCLVSNASLTHLLNNTVPFVKNKASLLGLPSLVQGSNLVYPSVSSVEETVVKEMVISNELIGCIIGRGGTTVNEIRNISKAHVKISNCEDGAKERKVTLSGTLQAVEMATFLINNRISAELFAGMVAFINQ